MLALLKILLFSVFRSMHLLKQLRPSLKLYTHRVSYAPRAPKSSSIQTIQVSLKPLYLCVRTQPKILVLTKHLSVLQLRSKLLFKSFFLLQHVVTPLFTTRGIPIFPNLLVPYVAVSQPIYVRGQQLSMQFFLRKLSERFLFPLLDVISR